MIHEPNTIEWKPGDLVIHDSNVRTIDGVGVHYVSRRSNLGDFDE
jgi:hypothetical protein